MQRILSLPILALLALALSTLMANGVMDRRQAANITSDAKTPPATATDLKPIAADTQSTGAETHPAGSASTSDFKASSNTSALPPTGAASTGAASTGAASTGAAGTGAASTGAAGTGAASTGAAGTGAAGTGAASAGGPTTVMPTTAGSANNSTSSVSNDKSTNSTKSLPPTGAKHSSAGQISCNFMVTFVVASLSLFAALLT